MRTPGHASTSDTLILQIWMNLQQKMQFNYEDLEGMQCPRIRTHIDVLRSRAPVIGKMHFEKNLLS